MKSSDKMSPMTAYYLRKLIQENQSQLIFLDHSSLDSKELNYPLSQTIHARIRDIPYPGVLEKLVDLHQALMRSDRRTDAQIYGVELQIYQLLGLKKKDSIDSDDSTRNANLSFSPEQYFHILKKILGVITRMDALIDPRVTRNYLKRTCPDSAWRKTNRNILESNNQMGFTKKIPLEFYEQWLNLFCQQWELCGEKTDQVRDSIFEKHRTHRSTPSNQSAANDSWQDFHQLIRLTSSVSKNPTPKRSRDLLKLLNAVFVKSAALIGATCTRYYLLESRPPDEWCHLFMLPEASEITYCGNIREIISSSRLKVFEQWMSQFWQKCEKKRSEILSISS